MRTTCAAVTEALSQHSIQMPADTLLDITSQHMSQHTSRHAQRHNECSSPHAKSQYTALHALRLSIAPGDEEITFDVLDLTQPTYRTRRDSLRVPRTSHRQHQAALPLRHSARQRERQPRHGPLQSTRRYRWHHEQLRLLGVPHRAPHFRARRDMQPAARGCLRLSGTTDHSCYHRPRGGPQRGPEALHAASLLRAHRAAQMSRPPMPICKVGPGAINRQRAALQ
mmetsp:Transcript_4616/g.7816  ORF Transcript_4616/g.7816 Transcript_4616/m.7816 type:complete len:225 (-) Transcript_4616:1130-1804(-)